MNMLKISKQNSLHLYSRQHQLQKQNHRLKQELRSSHQIISRLRNEVQDLKNQIKYLNMKNESSYNQSLQVSDIKQLKSPKSKSNKSLKLIKDFKEQMEVFTSESDSQTEQYSHYKPNSSLIHPLGKQKTKNVYFQQQKGITSLIKHKSTATRNEGSEIKLRGKGNQQRPLKKIDSTNIFHPVSYFDIDPDEDNNFAGLSSKMSNKQNFSSMSNINITKSQKSINITQREQNSTIKQQSKPRQPRQISQQKIFKKLSIGKPIYDVFFVTGLSIKGQPQILYSYPKRSPHFEPILSLCYSDDFIKVRQSQTSSTKNLLNVSSQNNQSKIKQFYVIPLRKAQTTENQKQYLIVCEVEEVILVQRDSSMLPCIFQRLYCFISSCQFFNTFKNLINQFLDKINGIKNQYKSLHKQDKYKEIIQQALEQPLSILAQKSAQSNHTLNYRLDSFISISIDIPSIENSYKLVSQFRPWGVMNFKVQLRPVQDYVSCLETKLFGVILAYALSEKKIILFSNMKSKISQCILHFLQIIRPLQYVCPVLMTALKEEHQEYFSAPMSLLLGLWVEQKKVQKQKIEIFMNRKQNLAGLIEKGKIQISDGIIINLDTGLIYGGGLSDPLSSLGLKINQYYENYCHHPKQIFKLFQKIFDKEINKNQTQILQIHQKLKHCLQGTQLYTYFRQKRNKSYKFS